MHTDFLAADVPLVKTFTLTNNEIQKSPYPMVRDFTSHRRPTASLAELHVALLEAATNGWCMHKGLLSRELKKESRAGSSNAADATQTLILDFDGLAGYESLDDALRPLGLLPYQRIVQWSASAHLPASSPPLLSAHVIFWLTSPVSPQLLKSWIMNANMTHFASSVTLTKSGAALHWPMDPSVMDNSKLIYIAPPVLRGLSSSITGLGIELVAPKNAAPSVQTSFFNVNPQTVQKAKMDLLNDLRKRAGYSAIRDSQLKTSSGQTYLSKPGAALLTGNRTERGFVYLNLNGGDSWGYYHPEDNPEYVYNFKGEPIYKTEELLPEYWASLKRIDPQRPQTKVRYFACRDFKADKLYNGIYYTEENRLVMARAQNEGRLKGFMKQHGQPVPDFIPDFEITYDPHNTTRFDFEKRYINLYEPSRFELAVRQGTLKLRRVQQIPPTIRKVLCSAVGADLETLHHNINWMADIIQNKVKTTTAWVLQGIEGTGKGVLYHLILRELVGPSNAVYITSRELDSPFNAYLEHALLVFVDEIQLPALRGSLGIAANLRGFITEPELAIRAMYSAPYKAANYSNFILASNMPDPVIIPPTDRRFHVGRFQSEKLTLSDREIQAIAEELSDFYLYLMSWKVDKAAVRTILESEDRNRLMSMSMTAADTMAASLIAGDMEDLVDNLPQKAVLPAETAYVELVKSLLTSGEGKLTRDELLTIFRYRVGDVPESPNKFTSFLKHHRMHTTKIRRGERSFWGLAVDWKQDEKWRKSSLLTMMTSQPKASVTSMTPRAKVVT
jgi:hypothetical protein